MDIGIIILVIVLCTLGLFGTILPALPGTGLIFTGIVLYALYFGIDTIGVTTLGILGVVTFLSFFIDYIASIYGGKKYGASKWGSIGSLLGGVVGFILLNFIGMFFGIFIGALIGEFFIAKKDTNASFRAGIGSLLGFLAGTLIKFFLGFAMIIVFVISIWK